MEIIQPHLSDRNHFGMHEKFFEFGKIFRVGCLRFVGMKTDCGIDFRILFGDRDSLPGIFQIGTDIQEGTDAAPDRPIVEALVERVTAAETHS